MNPSFHKLSHQINNIKKTNQDRQGRGRRSKGIEEKDVTQNYYIIIYYILN